MTRKIVILGSGGNCLDILDVLNDTNAAGGELVYECIGLLDDDRAKWGKEVFGVEVLGPLVSAPEYDGCNFVFGIGSEHNFWKRGEIVARAQIAEERFETIVHPTASVSRTAELGRGTVVFPNVTITSSVKIGKHVLILPSCVVSHNDIIGDFTCIAGGVCISGEVEIGRSCYLGTNASIKPRVKIGDECMVGMGSVVLEDIPANSVVAGNPARVLRATRAAERKS
jgi:sugar O-acyltransferase (sialic acid O-acetyltransferase NeuD family)